VCTFAPSDGACAALAIGVAALPVAAVPVEAFVVAVVVVTVELVVAAPARRRTESAAPWRSG
jgi:hypothetical protein